MVKGYVYTRPMIAALYVQTNGPYYGIEDVDPWDENRDARFYAGPHPVVAHPPCSRWCRLAGLVEARWGHKRGEDGGCFEAALNAVRTHGGVIEHPAYSDAWAAFDLNRPPTGGHWVNADMQGGWTCYVEQGRYGHAAKKATWLYAVGTSFPTLLWGHIPDTHTESSVNVTWCGNKTKDGGESRRRMKEHERLGTPDAFRDVLLNMARSVTAPEYHKMASHRIDKATAQMRLSL